MHFSEPFQSSVSLCSCNGNPTTSSFKDSPGQTKHWSSADCNSNNFKRLKLWHFETRYKAPQFSQACEVEFRFVLGPSKLNSIDSTSFHFSAARNNYDLDLDFKFCVVRISNKKLSYKFSPLIKQVITGYFYLGNSKTISGSTYLLHCHWKMACQ